MRDGLLEVFGSGLQLLAVYNEERSFTIDSKYLGARRGKNCTYHSSSMQKSLLIQSAHSTRRPQLLCRAVTPSAAAAAFEQAAVRAALRGAQPVGGAVAGVFERHLRPRLRARIR